MVSKALIVEMNSTINSAGDFEMEAITVLAKKRREGNDVTELQFEVSGVGCGGCYIGGIGKPGDACP